MNKQMFNNLSKDFLNTVPCTSYNIHAVKPLLMEKILKID